MKLAYGELSWIEIFYFVKGIVSLILVSVDSVHNIGWKRLLLVYPRSFV